jgi:hypothetical protein
VIRRSAFFLAGAVACFLLVPLSDEDLRWVPESVGAVYVVLALLTLLDDYFRERDEQR